MAPWCSCGSTGPCGTFEGALEVDLEEYLVMIVAKYRCLFVDFVDGV